MGLFHQVEGFCQLQLSSNITPEKVAYLDFGVWKKERPTHNFHTTLCGRFSLWLCSYFMHEKRESLSHRVRVRNGSISQCGIFVFIHHHHTPPLSYSYSSSSSSSSLPHGVYTESFIRLTSSKNPTMHRNGWWLISLLQTMREWSVFE